MPQPLISTWATTPSGWTPMHLRCVLSYSLRESILIKDYPPMGFGGSADIFQALIMDLMTSLEFV
jgi:hypothetical protein